MRTRHTLPLLVAAGLLAGCATQPGLQAAGFGQDDARQALVASLAGLKAGNYRFTREGAGSVSGAASLPRSARAEQGETAGGGWKSDATLLLDGKHFVRRTLPDGYRERLQGIVDGTAPVSDDGGPTGRLGKETVRQVIKAFDGRTWHRVDASQLPDVHILATPTADRPDVTGATELLTQARTATRRGDTITGTLDGTKTGRDGELFRAEPVTEFMGPAAAAMPYTAVLDPQGRLSRLTVTVPPVSGVHRSGAPVPSTGPGDVDTPSFRLVVTVTGYGQQTAPAAPPAGPALPRNVVNFLHNLD